MITWPSTHGVFEEDIQAITQAVHRHGGQVYLDGANLNAQAGLTSPGAVGADICHINLHKTFAIPHGGGGPGVGPVASKAHLAPFLPSHSFTNDRSVSDMLQAIPSGAVASAPLGSALVLPISYAYIKLLGPQGLRLASSVAILHANWVAHKLSLEYPILYVNKNGRVAHECIVDLRPIKAATGGHDGISETDIAKRLADYGFHAPTVSFPVPGTFMIEPTESEPYAELCRFILAMVSIREEIRLVEQGKQTAAQSVVRHAPHTAMDLADEGWDRSYSRKNACFPVSVLERTKYFPSVNRIDEVSGDRNLFCSCPPLEE